MKVEFLRSKGLWTEVLNAARATAGLGDHKTHPSSGWKRRMLMAEHSPIRQIVLKWRWIDLKSWISVHFVRHKNGIEHWVQSQRPDRTTIAPGTAYDRDAAPQGALVNHECEANAQEIIYISRKRLCNQAMPETREAWRAFLESFKETEPELYKACVRECVYRNGLCPEFRTCAFNSTDEFKDELAAYLAGFEGRIALYYDVVAEMLQKYYCTDGIEI